MEMGVWPMETCLAYACRHSIAWLVVAPHLPVARIARSEIWGWGFADTAFPAASRLPGAKRRAAGAPAFKQNEIPLKKHTNSSTSSDPPGRSRKSNSEGPGHTMIFSTGAPRWHPQSQPCAAPCRHACARPSGRRVGRRPWLDFRGVRKPQ